MFRKMLVANRGEIAARVIRTCREMGIPTLALYESSDKDSLHMRLAGECVQLDGPAAYFDIDRIIEIAKEKGADAVHPGYGFLAERPDFIRACEAAGITFIGPPAAVMARIQDKIASLKLIHAAGYPTVIHSGRSFGPDEYEMLQAEAAVLGYPLVIKSSAGGRGRGERLVTQPENLADTVRRAQVESQAVYGDREVYLERAIVPAHQIGVQIVADRHGRIIHLGEREGSILAGNQKVIEESPAPCLTLESRRRLWEAAVEIARLLNYQNVGTVEFLADETGNFYFSEIKARIQADHPLAEMITGVDLVREQIRIAAGEAAAEQGADAFSGWAMIARIRAENPWEQYMPSPGRLTQVRFPGGPGVRVDSHAACHFDVSAAYDPLISKITVWATDRQSCLARLRCAVEECRITGTYTNLPLLQWVLQNEAFVAGKANTELTRRPFQELLSSHGEPLSSQQVRELAITAAVLYVRRNQQMVRPELPERFIRGWHRNSRHVTK